MDRKRKEKCTTIQNRVTKVKPPEILRLLVFQKKQEGFIISVAIVYILTFQSALED